MIARPTGERIKTDESMRDEWSGELIYLWKGERTKSDESMREKLRSGLTDPQTDVMTRVSTTDDLTNTLRSKRKNE